MKKQDSKQRLFEVMLRLDKTFKSKLNENFEEFTPHGTYTISNTGGYEIMLSPDGEEAKVRDAFGSDNPKTSDWLKIEYIPDEETGESEPVIDPNGYNIPLNQVMRINEDIGYDYQAPMLKGPRPLSQIARDIYRDWKPVSPYAKDYLDAMASLNSIDDRYMFDSGREIVARFLSNASQWKGENAKRIKAELKKMLGIRESCRINETGEWIGDEDDVAWMEALKSEVQKIESETGGKLKLIDVRGFDKYQGPYAIVDINGRKFKIWTVGQEGEPDLLWIENYPIDNTSQEGANAGFMGTSGIIADMLNGINETPIFGGEKVSQEMYDELQYDKGEMEKAMGDAFKTPPDYQMKNQVKAGQTVELSDGDKVLIKKIDTPRGLIDVRVYPTDENGKKYYPKGFFDITWSLKQFDAIVGDNTSLNMTEVEKEIDEYFKKPYSTYGKSGDPRIITLKYDTVCTETGKPLKAGEKAIYYPRTKDFFCLDSKQADEFRGWKQDMDMGYDY